MSPGLWRRSGIRWAAATPLALALGVASPAAAHQERPLTVAEASGTWNPDVLVLAAVAIPVVLYWLGSSKLRRPTGTPQRRQGARDCSFLAGMVVLFAALISPVDALSSVLFSVHMTQHLLLTVVAPPLLVLGRPSLPLVLGLPPVLRRFISRARHRATSLPGASALLVILILVGSAVVLWAWHAPVLYMAALENPLIHGLEHLTLFVAALVVWTLAIPPDRPGVAVGALVFTSLQGVALGALLTFSSRNLYPLYQTEGWGLSALEHQQLGGLLMWIPGGMVYAGFSLWVLLSRVGLTGEERFERSGAALAEQ